MSSQISKIIQVDNARGMEQRFRFISAKNTFDWNAQKIAAFSKVNVGERRVFKLYLFYNHPTFRRKVGAALAFLSPLEVGVGGSDVDVVVEFASLSRVSF